jgi:hypothetical protein
LARKSVDLGLVSILIAAVTIGGLTIYRFEAEGEPTSRYRPTVSKQQKWTQNAKARCKPAKLESFLKDEPPPTKGHETACLALADEIDKARAVLEKLSTAERGKAIGIVFNLIHPIADGGDEVAAGPGMELVAEFWPQNYQAIYHAGIAAYEKRDDERAKRHLTRFLEMYKRNDGFGKKAKRVLGIIEQFEKDDATERPRLSAH